jgi:hypothetical protein
MIYAMSRFFIMWQTKGLRVTATLHIPATPIYVANETSPRHALCHFS